MRHGRIDCVLVDLESICGEADEKERSRNARIDIGGILMTTERIQDDEGESGRYVDGR
jgi:hypothetical protein